MAERIYRAAPAAGAVALNIELDRKTAGRIKLLASVSRGRAAIALNEAAQSSVHAWRVTNHRVFHMRRRWIDSGVRYNPATSSNLNAQVGTIDRYMGRHVVGIGEEKVSAGRGLFVPMKPAPEQGTHTQTRTWLNRMRGTKRKPFVIRAANGKVMIVRRKGKARTPLEVLGLIEHGVHIVPRLDAGRVVYDVVAHEFGPVYERLLIAWAEKNQARL